MEAKISMKTQISLKNHQLKIQTYAFTFIKPKKIV